METLESKSLLKTKQNIQLVEGSFTPSEALDVIVSLLDQKINFHKLQRLSLCEGYCDADTLYPDGRIKELQDEENVARDFISKMRKEGRNLKINGVLEISIED